MAKKEKVVEQTTPVEEGKSLAYVSLRNIDKVYDNKVQAVFDFNLDINKKEFIVFVGPSGCGKSTTLRMIAGLEDITAGELWIDGVYSNDRSPKDRDIAMVFQSYALYPHMSVYENMAFGLKIRKFAKAEIDRRVREAAKILEIEEYLERKPKALSGGQRQRVALGRAIVRNAKVFLMDEPLSNLDAKLRVQMRSEIIKLHEALGATTIYVTHDQTEAMTMATRIVVMKAGYIQQVGSPIEIYNNPANLFVAGFIGSPAMNFINATYNKGAIEFSNGKTIKASIKAGFKRSLAPVLFVCGTAIVIALLTFAFGFGSLRNFGIVLGIGSAIAILVNLLFVRLIVALFLPLLKKPESFLNLKREEEVA